MRKLKQYLYILVVLVSFQTANASVFYVSNAFNSGFGSFNNALNATQAGDTIMFSENMNGGFINVSTTTTIDKSITILGPSKGVTFRRQSNFFLMFDIVAEKVIIKNVNFIAGFVGVMKYTNSLGDLQLINCRFSNNQTQDYNTPSNSSALEFDGNRLIIEACKFENNSVFNGTTTGEKYINYITTNHITVTKSVFTQNVSQIGGAMVINFRGQLSDRSALISNCSFIDNTAEQTAGAMLINSPITLPYNPDESISFINNTFAGNRCSDNIGAIVCRYGGNVELIHNTIVNNSGGGIWGDTRVRFSIENNVFAQNITSQLPPLMSNFRLDNTIEVTGSNFIDFVPQSLINEWFIDSDNYLQNPDLVSTSVSITPSPVSSDSTSIEGIPVFLPSSSTSIIVGAATPSSIDTDQVGHPRTILGTPDLGSVEFFEYGTGIANAGDNITSCGRVTMGAELSTEQIGKWVNKTQSSNLNIRIEDTTDPQTVIEFGVHSLSNAIEHQFTWSVLDLNTGILDTTRSVIVTIIPTPNVYNNIIQYCNGSLDEYSNGLEFYSFPEGNYSIEWTELNGLRPFKLKEENQSSNNQKFTFTGFPDINNELEVSYRISAIEHPSCIIENSAIIQNTVTIPFDPTLIENVSPTSVENVYFTNSTSIIAPDLYNNANRSNFSVIKQNTTEYLNPNQGILSGYDECTPYNVSIYYNLSGNYNCNNYEADFTLLYHESEPCLAIVNDIPNEDFQSSTKAICSSSRYNLKAITLPEQSTLNYQWSINPSNADLVFGSSDQKLTTISFDGTNIPSTDFSIIVTDGVRTTSLDEVKFFGSGQLEEDVDYEVNHILNNDLFEIIVFQGYNTSWQYSSITDVDFITQTAYLSSESYLYILNNSTITKSFNVMLNKTEFGVTCPQTATIPINFGTTTIIAGEDQFVCRNTTTLDATPLVQGQIGTWAVAAGNATISQPNNPKSPVSNLSAGQNEFTWTVTQNGNQIAQSSVSIYYEGAQLVSDTLINVCANTPTSISIEAKSVSITDFYSGAWYLSDSLISGNASYTLEDTLSASTYNYTWRVSRGSACSSYVDVVVVAGTPPVFPDTISIDTTNTSPRIVLSTLQPVQGFVYTIESEANNGVVTPTDNPFIHIYETNRGFLGQDSLRFTITTACGIEEVTSLITIRNSAPSVRLPDYRAQGIQAMPLSFNIYDSLDISDLNFNIDSASLSLAPTTAVAAAPVSWTENGNVIVNYSLSPDFYGIDSVRYDLCDVLDACLSGFLRISLLRNEPSDRLLPIEVYNAISPNGDNKHDFLYILNITEPVYANNRVVIYSRWGDIIYDESGYDNASKVWSGQSKSGNLVPDGTYFYTIYLDKDKGKADNNLIKGYVYVNSGGN